MPTTDELKTWIDEAEYEDLLRKWRCAPAGDPLFIGEVGDYYTSVMKRKREEVGADAHVRASKQIGWV